MVKKFSEKLKAQSDRKLLQAISSLKRVIHAADHPLNPDYISETGMAQIHTTDGESAAILNALFHQFLHGDRPLFTRGSQGEFIPHPRNFAFGRSNSDLFEIEVFVPKAKKPQFFERLENYIELFTAPTTSQASDDKLSNPSKSKPMLGPPKGR